MSQRFNKTQIPNRGQFSDYYEFNAFNHTVHDHDIRPPRNEAYLYSPRFYNNRLVINSSSRNKSKYPNNASYTVDLDRPYYKVTSIELVQAIIPFSGFSITETNNALHFQESDGEIYKIVIPPGNYTAEELAQILQDEMNKVGESNYTVTVLANQNKFKFTSDLSGGDGDFKLIFEGEIKNKGTDDEEITYICQSIGEIIGFPPMDFCRIIGHAFVEDNSEKVFGKGTKFLASLMVGDKIQFEDDLNLYTVTEILSDTILTILPNKIGSGHCVKIFPNSFVGPNSYELEPVKYLALFLNEELTENLNKIDSNNNAIQNAFCVIPKFLNDTDNTVVINKATLPNVQNIFHFHPLVEQLSKLVIKFTDNKGRLYDFNGREHLLEFNIRTLNEIGN